MGEELEGIKFSEFPSASPSNTDEVVGLHAGNNARFSILDIIFAVRQGLANIFVPLTRTVNSKALSADITLDASDVSAVPTTRTVNNKALSADIALDASDVGARPYDWMPTAAQVGAEAEIQLGSISLSASWLGAGPYTQTVTVSGATVTANSKVDIQLTATQISTLISAGVKSLLIENNSGVLTAYAVGAQTSAMTVQVTVTEVA